MHGFGPKGVWVQMVQFRDEGLGIELGILGLAAQNQHRPHDVGGWEPRFGVLSFRLFLEVLRGCFRTSA